MAKKYLISLLIVNFALFSPVFAQTASETPSSTSQSETVTTADLGVENPGLLPTNPFYFIKEWGRGVHLFFTFNSVAKVELELRFVNEKAAEVKAVETARPDDAPALNKALENYQKSQESLKAKFESLKETSKNPNVDRLLNQLAERTVKHEKLFDELSQKTNSDEAKSAIQNIRGKIGETVSAASNSDDSTQFVARLEKFLSAENGSALKSIRSVEILDNLGDKASDDLKPALKKLRTEFSDKAKEDFVKSGTNAAGVKAAPTRVEPSFCKYTFQQQWSRLEKSLASDSVSKEDYEIKYAALKNELTSCENPAVPEKNQKPVGGAIIDVIPVKPEYVKERASNIVCAEEYKPVCGSNGKSYSNACFAKADGISVSYEGVCKSAPATEEAPKQITPLNTVQPEKIDSGTVRPATY